MSEKFQIRPRFKLLVKLPFQEILKKLKNGLDNNKPALTGWVADRSASIQVNEDRHIWSPQLTVYVEEIDEGCEVRCVIGPNSNIWTTIVFFYSIVGLGALLGLFWGLSQLTLNHTPYALWFIPIAGILTAGIFYMAKVGQKLSADQMKVLNDFIEETFGDEAEVIE